MTGLLFILSASCRLYRRLTIVVDQRYTTFVKLFEMMLRKFLFRYAYLRLGSKDSEKIIQDIGTFAISFFNWQLIPFVIESLFSWSYRALFHLCN